jgi:hypothetical protein
MPKTLFPRFYGLAYRSAQRTFGTPIRQQWGVRARAGTPWYRYVGYRNSMPQVEGAGRTQFLTLANDVNNRWTGCGPDGRGSQGLYLSQDFVNDGDPFPELSYYQSGGDGGADLVPSYEYHPGSSPAIDPTMKVEHATNLRSMFHFTLTEDLEGLDLRLAGQTNSLLEAVQHAMAQDPEYEAIRAETKGTFDLANLESMYQHPEGADFCRALGNAALALPDVRHLLVTSVRDGRSTNVVARTPVRADGAPPRQLDFLRPEGRATFFVNSGGRRGIGVFSIPDMIYNTNFESPDSPPPELPDVKAFKQTLVRTQQVAIDELSSRVLQDLEIQPATPQMDKVAEGIANVQDKLTGDQYGATIAAITELKTAVAAAAEDPPTVGQFKASLDLSTGVANTMSSMADAVQAAQDRIDGMETEPPDVIDDPDPDALEPSRSDPAHGQG